MQLKNTYPEGRPRTGHTKRDYTRLAEQDAKAELRDRLQREGRR